MFVHNNQTLSASLLFSAKVAFACAFVEFIAHSLIGDSSNTLNSFLSSLFLYWFLGSFAFYGWGAVIEVVLKPAFQNQPPDASKNGSDPASDELLMSGSIKTSRISIRTVPVKAQPYPSFSPFGLIKGEAKSILISAIILFLASNPLLSFFNASPSSTLPSNASAATSPIRLILWRFLWFYGATLSADLLFYWSHRSLHSRALYFIHKTHHEYKDTSAFVAGHKSHLESIITTITDILPFILLGATPSQLIAWSVVGSLFNLEGHSGVGFLFISTNFHDLHHTHYDGNYGVQALWDCVFGTLNPRTTGVVVKGAGVGKKLDLSLAILITVVVECAILSILYLIQYHSLPLALAIILE